MATPNAPFFFNALPTLMRFAALAFPKFNFNLMEGRKKLIYIYIYKTCAASKRTCAFPMHQQRQLPSSIPIPIPENSLLCTATSTATAAVAVTATATARMPTMLPVRKQSSTRAELKRGCSVVKYQNVNDLLLLQLRSLI